MPKRFPEIRGMAPSVSRDRGVNRGKHFGSGRAMRASISGVHLAALSLVGRDQLDGTIRCTLRACIHFGDIGVRVMRVINALCGTVKTAGSGLHGGESLSRRKPRPALLDVFAAAARGA